MEAIKLLDAYEFACPECNTVYSAPPSDAMRSGHNRAIMRCSQCKKLLDIKITPDLGGSAMLAEVLFGDKKEAQDAAA